MIEQYIRTREALTRAKERSTSQASRDFLGLIVAKIDERMAAIRHNRLIAGGQAVDGAPASNVGETDASE